MYGNERASEMKIRPDHKEWSSSCTRHWYDGARRDIRHEKSDQIRTRQKDKMGKIKDDGKSDCIHPNCVNVSSAFRFFFFCTAVRCVGWVEAEGGKEE
jgi:hypothetical protein